MYIHPKAFMFSTEYFTTCPDYFRIFSGDFSRRFLMATFPGMLENIPQKVSRHSRNIWQHSPYSPRSPHSVSRSCIPGFLPSFFCVPYKTCNLKILLNHLLTSSLEIQWRLISATDILCSRPRFWVSYFIYFKFTSVIF